MRITYGLNVALVMNCAGNTGAMDHCAMCVVLASCKEVKPELRKKVLRGVANHLRKAWRRKDGSWIFFEGFAGVVVNDKGEMKGSAFQSPVLAAKEYAEPWPNIASCAASIC